MKLRKHDSKAPKRQRAKNEKGLPDANARRDLAETYLRTQGRLFPDLVKKGILPRANAKNISRLAEEFESAFLSGTIAAISGKVSTLPMALAAAYLRYSDDNSNPRSLDQQLRNALERAAQDQVFIPWTFVCADAAVTGTIADRRGYKMMKSLIESEDNSVGNFYIDEIGRASRSAIEALTLGKLIESHQRRLIGVSDAFDSATPQSKLMLGMFALLHEWYVDQLREKVNRGMDDAFERGANIYEAAIGYRLEQATDQYNNPVFDPDGTPINIKVIDEEGAKWVKKAFELYTLKRWSRQRIAKHFNRHEVDGKRSWDSGRIKQLLTRETYNGRECYRMTCREVDVASGRTKTVKRPRAEWKIRKVPHLKFISDELWETTQKRMQECADAYSKNGKRRRNRIDVYHKMLFRPVCKDCQKPLTLGHGGKHASFRCKNGVNDKHGCTLKTYKSRSIIEQSILKHLKESVLTEAYLSSVVSEANKALAKMAKEPKDDVRPILREIKNEQKKLDRYGEIVATAGKEQVPSIVQKLCACEARIAELQRAKADAEAHNAPPPPPISMAEVPEMLSNLQGLLNEEVEVAAPLLAVLTGPILVSEGQEKSKRGKTWIAHFTINAVPVVARLAAARNSPSSDVWEFLSSIGWRMSKDVDVDIQKLPKYAVFGQEFLELNRKGVSISAIAAEYNVTRQVVRNGIHFAKTGEKPPTKPRKRRKKGDTAGTRPKAKAIYREIAPLVAELMDGQGLTAEEAQEVVQQELGRPVSLATIRRAYYHARKDLVKAACEFGKDLRQLRKRQFRTKRKVKQNPVAA